MNKYACLLSIWSVLAIGTTTFGQSPRLKKLNEPRELKFDTHFEELGPGRNSASNEWSTFGARDNESFNNIGRDMRVRYPAFDLVFRLNDGKPEIAPDSLDSFRLGLVRGNLPAIWGAWEKDGVKYRVSVMSAPFNEKGAFDLYKLEVQNTGKSPAKSELVAGFDGSPDMKLAGDVVAGLGGAAFAIIDPAADHSLMTRDWGVCDKRAKSYRCGDGPGPTEPAISSTRIGMDGLPVVYRVKVDPKAKFNVVVAASPHISGLLGAPQKPGDLIFQYDVEGAPSQTLDWSEYIAKKPQPIALRFDGAHDTNGDGYIEVRAGVADKSRLKHTRLSAIYIFPESVKPDDLSKVYSGSMNAQCVAHVDVGVTPECDWSNQLYDQSDVGLCRLNLNYGGEVAPGKTKTFWLKVPPIYRRQPVSMGSYAHAFKEVMPHEAVPPFDDASVKKLREIEPIKAWQGVIDDWDRFFAKAAQIDTPDPVLKGMFLSRLATRAVMDIRISDKVWYNACSPWFYFDFAYRDQAYLIYAYDLAGLHDLAARQLNSYCMETKDVPLGPISFADRPLQLGQSPDGLWLTRPGQYDAQGQNLWCMVEHYKLSGDHEWLEKSAYEHIARGAMWLVNSRHKEMAKVKDANDPRYGLIEPGAMEVAAITRGMHMYYMDAWAVLGLREAADAAAALGNKNDAEKFAKESNDLRDCLNKSMRKTFKRVSLYQGYIWFGVEPEGDGMYGFWGHTPLLWPTRAVDPHEPMFTGTFEMMERMAHDWGGDMYSDGAGGCWPYIGVDLAISAILRGEPETTLDYFCAFTDTAGQTLSWGEGYSNASNTAGGDQPHMWADAQWINLYRHLFAMEDGATLRLTPATLRRWQRGDQPVHIEHLPTQFGSLDLTIQPRADGGAIDYRFRLDPKGDQASRALDKIVIDARTSNGRSLKSVTINGEPIDAFFNETVIVPHAQRGKEYDVKMFVE